MKVFFGLAVALVFLAISGCSSNPSPVAPITVMEVSTKADLDLPDNITKAGVYTGKSEYRIGPQDLLEVFVFQVDDLKREIRVNSTGQISLPLIGVIQAGGKTVLELEAEIANKLKNGFLQNPQVTIFIKQFTSQRVTVEGAVKTPNIYPIMGKTSLLQALALAGGVDQNLADMESILVFRTVNGARMAARFNLQHIREGLAADPQIYGDDIVVVGTSSKKWAYKRFVESIPLLNTFILF